MTIYLNIDEKKPEIELVKWFHLNIGCKNWNCYQ